MIYPNLIPSPPKISDLISKNNMKRNLYKVIILGNSAVGKTSLLHSFVDQKFQSSYKATIGADMLESDVVVDGKAVSLVIVDTAGQERFRSMGEAFYRGANCVVLVYDITDKASFESIESWITEFLSKGSPEEPDKFPFVLIGNKIDRERQRKVEEGDIEEFLRKHPRVIHLKTSAKDRQGIELVFESVARAAVQYKKQQIYIPMEVPSTKLTSRANRKKQRKTCC